MKQIAAFTLALALTAAPVAAQDGELEDGFNLIEEGARMLMRGLMSEMEPTIEGLRESLDDIAPVIGEFAREIGPAFAELLAQVDDFRHYGSPEFLPNGDILIRRKPDAPVWMPDDVPGEVEL